VSLNRRLVPSTVVAALAACAAASSLLPAAASARVTAADAGAPVLVVGDSLAVGLRPYLAPLLGANVGVAWDAKTGRTTPQGLVALRDALKFVKPQTVIVSLGTNDGSDPTRFESRIDRVISTIGPKACIVWSNIYRPARKGPYAALNTVLNSEAQRVSRLHLIDWNAAVARRSVHLKDGLHPDPAGFEYRSRMLANAVHDDCGPASLGDAVDGVTGPGTGADADGTGGVTSPD
jgi:lysophospholipase L1-like esterase